MNNYQETYGNQNHVINDWIVSSNDTIHYPDDVILTISTYDTLCYS